VPQVPEFDEAGFTTLKGDVMTLFNPTPKFNSPAIRDLFRPPSTKNGVPKAV